MFGVLLFSFLWFREFLSNSVSVFILSRKTPNNKPTPKPQTTKQQQNPFHLSQPAVSARVLAIYHFSVISVQLQESNAPWPRVVLQLDHQHRLELKLNNAAVGRKLNFWQCECSSSCHCHWSL